MELLPSAGFRVQLDNGNHPVLVHAAGSKVKNFVRLRPGDRVEVKLSPHDPTRGRLMKLLSDEHGSQRR
jgi:translation initiation factor IF-1